MLQRLFFKLAGVVVVALVVSVPFVTSESTFASERSRADAWVAANRAALPTTLEGYRDFSPTYRKAITAAHSAEIKSRLWREQLAEFVEMNVLTAEQLAFVRQVQELATPKYFADRDNPHVIDSGDAKFIARSRQLFPERDKLAAFYVLGSVLRSHGGDYIVGDSSGPSAAEACECRDDDNWCAFDCIPGGCTVTNPCQGEEGCGWMEKYACDGTCLSIFD